jgi:hypothetical protein
MGATNTTVVKGATFCIDALRGWSGFAALRRDTLRSSYARTMSGLPGRNSRPGSGVNALVRLTNNDLSPRLRSLFGGSPGTRFRRRQRTVVDGRNGRVGGCRPSATRWRRCNTAPAERQKPGTTGLKVL